ncbi:FAD synthetase [Bacillus rhizoplanae]|uniref:FAD synthetase n=1 Tax=Bacillus rhizoplanae TaxID=2880966 RepID=UPI003D19D029
METHINEILRLPGSVIAIGAFDGVHQGHQAVIREAVKKARILGVPSVVYTFDPPPRHCFQGARILTPVPKKLVRLEQLGIDHVIIARFDELYASRHPLDFIKNLMNLNPLEIMVGEDFRFGKNREGDINLLARHFCVQIAQPVCCSDGILISSTRIRQLISKGDIKQSYSLLGWPLGS